MRKVVFAEGEIYHIYNRGANKCEVFFDDLDRERFIADMLLMNSTTHQLNVGYRFVRNSFLLNGESAGYAPDEGTCLVDIAAFVLMPNHFHLLVKQRVDGGISAFMQKFGTAYTMYFNRRHSRSGVLFQGVFASKIISTDAYFEEIPFYIHGNPLKLAGQLQSVDADMGYLASYKWSSFCDYLGVERYGHLLRKDMLQDYFFQRGGAAASMRAYLSRKRGGSPIEASPPIEVSPR